MTLCAAMAEAHADECNLKVGDFPEVLTMDCSRIHALAEEASEAFDLVLKL